MRTDLHLVLPAGRRGGSRDTSTCRRAAAGWWSAESPRASAPPPASRRGLIARHYVLCGPAPAELRVRGHARGATRRTVLVLTPRGAPRSTCASTRDTGGDGLGTVEPARRPGPVALVSASLVSGPPSGDERRLRATSRRRAYRIEACRRPYLSSVASRRPGAAGYAPPSRLPVSMSRSPARSAVPHYRSRPRRRRAQRCVRRRRLTWPDPRHTATSSGLNAEFLRGAIRTLRPPSLVYAGRCKGNLLPLLGARVQRRGVLRSAPGSRGFLLAAIGH